MQTLQHVVEFFHVVVRAIKFGERVEPFATTGRISRKTRPELFTFNGQVPFAGETREFDLILGLSSGGVKRGAPKSAELGIGIGLTRSPGSESLIGKPEIIVVSPRLALRPTAQTQPIFLLGKSSSDRDGGRRFDSGRGRQLVHPINNFGREAVFVHP